MSERKRNASSRLSTPFHSDADLLIAGGGISGLVAARLAQSAGLRVLLLEAEPDVGGNARSGTLPEGTRYPKGSTVLCTYSDEQRAFLRELGVELDPKHRVLPDRVFIDDEWLNLWSEGKPPENEFESQIDEFAKRCERILTGARGEVAMTVHDLPKGALEWDKKSFSEAFAALPRKLKATLDTILRSDAARSGNQVSALASMVDLLLCLKGEGFVLPGGNHAIVRALLERIRGAKAPLFPVDIRTGLSLVGVSEGESQVVARVRDSHSGLFHSLRADHVLLAMPSQAVVSLSGVNLTPSAREALSSLPRGPYTIVSLFFDYCPLESSVFHMSPGTKLVTDVLQVNAYGDCSVPLGADVPSVLTAYLPGVPSAKRPSDEANLLARTKAEIKAMFPGNRRLHDSIDRAHSDITTFRQAMSAPAPGQVAQLYDVDPRPSPRVHYAHSDLAFFSAIGAVEAARRAMAHVLDQVRPTLPTASWATSAC